VNVYSLPDELPDYPPHALVLLSPLAWLSTAWSIRAWAALNVGLAVAAPWLAVRTVRPAVNLSTAALLVLMFLCWSGFRTLLQFTLLALTFGLLAVRLADERPRLSGLCLGLSLIKPQIAAPFVLWALFTRRPRLAIEGVAVVAAGFLLFCLRARVDPLVVVRDYLHVLQTLYTGDAVMVGISQLRPLIARALSDTRIVDALSIAVALTMLAVICVAGFAEGRRRNPIIYSAPSLVALWSLLTFYSLTYGFILLLPTAALLVLADDRDTVAFRRRVFWTMQAGLMIDVPGLWRWFGHLVSLPDLAAALSHFDRALMLVLALCVGVLSVKRVRAAVSTEAPPAREAVTGW
jgi:hypothetical protein